MGLKVYSHKMQQTVALPQLGRIFFFFGMHPFAAAKSQLACHTMHQNLAITLQEFNYNKNSCIVLIPGLSWLPNVYSIAKSVE